MPVGRFVKDIPLKKIKDIDINKAFTHAGGNIKYIPKFTQFDIFRPSDEDCSTDQFNNLTLYIVEVYEGNIFFNKKYCLVYGKFLKKLLKHNVKLKILWYIQAVFTYSIQRATPTLVWTCFHISRKAVLRRHAQETDRNSPALRYNYGL